MAGKSDAGVAVPSTLGADEVRCRSFCLASGFSVLTLCPSLLRELGNYNANWAWNSNLNDVTHHGVLVVIYFLGSICSFFNQSLLLINRRLTFPVPDNQFFVISTVTFRFVQPSPPPPPPSARFPALLDLGPKARPLSY